LERRRFLKTGEPRASYSRMDHSTNGCRGAKQEGEEKKKLEGGLLWYCQKSEKDHAICLQNSNQREKQQRIGVGANSRQKSGEKETRRKVSAAGAKARNPTVIALVRPSVKSNGGGGRSKV